MTPSRRDASRPATMRDVAERCGVSIKTVSRVVNGEPGTSEATHARILEAIADLGFRPNRLARDLRQFGPTSTIGVVIEDVANPFYGSMIRAIERRAGARGSMVLTVSSDEDPAREQELVRELLSRRVAGLVVVSARDDNSYLAPHLRGGLAVVFADRPGVGVECDEVLLDNEAGAREAADLLLRHGHRRLAVVADAPHIYTARTRVRAFTDAVGEADVVVREGCHTVEQARAAVTELLAAPQPPTGLFAANNRAAVGAIHARHDRSSTLEVVGFDDFEFAGLLDPPVSVIAHDPAELGDAAATLLFDRVADPDAPPRRLSITGQVRERGVPAS